MRSLLGLAVATVCVAAGSQTTSGLAGTVRDAQTLRGIAGARVSAAPARARGSVRESIADRNGRFELHDLPSGRHVLRAEAAGFLPGGYGQVLPSDEPIPLAIGPAGRPEADIQLWRAANLAGRVSLDGDEPAPRIAVSLVAQQGLRAGGPRPPRTTITDEEGRYAFRGVEPGEFAVCVVTSQHSAPAAPSGVPPPQPETTLRGSQAAGLWMRVGDSWLRYPSITASSPWVSGGTLFVRPTTCDVRTMNAGAGHVLVGVGDDLFGIDIELRAHASFPVSGTVAAEGRAAAGVTVRAFRSDAGRAAGPAMDEVAVTETGADGKFILLGLVAGDYRIAARPSNVTHTASSAQVSVTVGTEPLTGVSLDLRQGLVVGGRVVASAGADVPRSLLKNLTINVVGVDDRRSNYAGSVTDSGRFLAGPLIPGRYVVEVPGPLPPPWVLEDVQCSGESVDGRVVALTERSLPDCTVVLTEQLGRIDVRVHQSVPVDSVAIALLAPAERARWPFAAIDSRRFRHARLNAQGSASFQAVPPGAYLVAVVSNTDARVAAWTTPAHLHEFMRRAAQAAVRRGERAAVAVSWAGR